MSVKAYLFVFLKILSTFTLFTLITPEKCHEILGKEALGLFGTNRNYHFDQDQASRVSYTPEGCQAEKLWYFGRHGTRYPEERDVEEMEKLLPLLYDEIVFDASDSSLCPSTIQYFMTWTPRTDLNTSTESYLTTQGFQEVSLISTRFKNRYSQLFPSEFSNTSYHFRFADSQRTEVSTEAFASSIFGIDNLETVWFPLPSSKDPILKFYSSCEKYKTEVDENPAGIKEHDKFVIGPVMKSTIARVSRRLGFQSRRNLTIVELTAMYKACTFESASWNGTISQWCAVFDMEDLTVMEYAEDLLYYWKDGYGFNINWEQACPPFKDALQFFDESSSTVQSYFSDSGAILKMLARLGLFSGNATSPMEIRADNFEEMKHIYEWKTSMIDFMGSNLAFVLYTCGNGESSEKQIGSFFQELPIPLPACGNKALCSYELFKSRISEFAENCDLEKICRV